MATRKNRSKTSKRRNSQRGGGWFWSTPAGEQPNTATTTDAKNSGPSTFDWVKSIFTSSKPANPQPNPVNPNATPANNQTGGRKTRGRRSKK